MSRTGNVSEIFVSFQGEGLHAGRRQVFVRLAGCPLRCRYCDTPDSLVPVDQCRVATADGVRFEPNPVSVAVLGGLVDQVARPAPPLHALALTGGEPLSQADFVVEWLGARPLGWPVLLETAGILPDRLRQVLPFVSIVSFDVKCPSNSGERPLWDAHAACLEIARASSAEFYVKVPVDESTDVDEVAHAARLVASIAPDIVLFLTPLTPPNRSTFTIGARALEEFHAAASARHRDVRVLPQLHKVLGIP